MDKDRIVLPTCEVSMDPETAIEMGRSWGIKHFEIKTLWENRRIPFITEEQKDHLKRVVKDYGVDITAISPGLFIGSEAREDLAKKELDEKLPLSIDLAKELDVKIMVIFSFRKTERVEESWVIDKLGKVVDAAKDAEITLVIEPLIGNYCDSGGALSRVIRGVGSDTLRVNWDAGNVAKAGYKAFPDEYDQVKDLVSYVHLKNYSSTGDKWAVFDEGDIDLKAQLDALGKDDYNGYLSIETHTRYNKSFQPVLEASKWNFDILTKWR